MGSVATHGGCTLRHHRGTDHRSRSLSRLTNYGEKDSSSGTKAVHSRSWIYRLVLRVWLAVILAISLLVTAFGSLKIAGSGMTPTLEKSEPLIYHKYVDRQSVKPGAITVYNNADDSAWGQPGWIAISRILAGPGDDVSVQNGKYVANGTAGPPVADTGQYDVVLNIPVSPEFLTIPDDCHFIFQESQPVASTAECFLGYGLTISLGRDCDI